MKDVIYRQDAIDSVQRIGRLATLTDNDAVIRMSAVEYVLYNLPSAQPEPCEDAVSRKAVYEAMIEKGQRSRRYRLGETWELNGAEIRETLDTVPPVTPKRKTGKWNFIGDQMFECTECGTCYTQNQFHQMMVRITDPEFPNFCPNCGAKMNGGEQE